MAQPKITILPSADRRCAACGGTLPRGRRRKCFTCLPPKSHRPETPPAVEQEYTLADRVAQAEARCMSYGNFMAFLHNGWKLPPLVKPIRWPNGSAHIGERE